MQQDPCILLKNLLSAKNRQEFRDWLQKNHCKESECWVILKLGRPKDSKFFWYIDAVEEALCFGWIDSILRRISPGHVAHHFTPRREKNSPWTELNKARYRRMEALGWMTDAGRKVYPDKNSDNFQIDPEILSALQKDMDIWKNFQQFPSLYQRVRIDKIQSYKRKNPSLFHYRLQKLIDNTAKGIMYGQWNDYGRLLEY